MNVILITGCSSGFGMVMAARLAACGHTVYASMRNLGKKDDLLTEVARRGANVRLLQLDVTDDETIAATLARIDKETGRLDVLINNAGYAVGGFFEDLSEQEIRDQMETNFFGVQKVTRHALPLMRKTAASLDSASGVKIINISSGQGRSPIPGLSAYSSSKFALEGFSEGLCLELRPFGIDVIIVEPGSFRTKIFDENGRRAEQAGTPESPYTPYTRLMQNRIRRMLKSRAEMGNPERVAAVIEGIVSNPRPRLRYVIGARTRLRIGLRQLLPFSWFAHLVHKILFGKLKSD